ncbi:hypothetical protein FOA52_013668 [Chlamydomonas sp. UWO 241]|nr:hypothetical protein FOA52_013668 [Chlamydomonas sp. UWO 241]
MADLVYRIAPPVRASLGDLKQRGSWQEVLESHAPEDVLFALCICGSEAGVRGLLETRIGLHVHCQDALVHATYHGHAGVVRLLLEWRGDPNDSPGVLAAAAQFGQADIVQLVLETVPHFPPFRQQGWAMLTAATHRHTDIVQLLLQSSQHAPFAAIHSKIGSALEYAAKRGHLETVRLLLQALEASLFNLNQRKWVISSSLGVARNAGHHHIAEEMAPVLKAPAAWATLMLQPQQEQQMVQQMQLQLQQRQRQEQLQQQQAQREEQVQCEEQLRLQQQVLQMLQQQQRQQQQKHDAEQQQLQQKHELEQHLLMQLLSSGAQQPRPLHPPLSVLLSHPVLGAALRAARVPMVAAGAAPAVPAVALAVAPSAATTAGAAAAAAPASSSAAAAPPAGSAAGPAGATVPAAGTSATPAPTAAAAAAAVLPLRGVEDVQRARQGLWVQQQLQQPQPLPQQQQQQPAAEASAAAASAAAAVPAASAAAAAPAATAAGAAATAPQRQRKPRRDDESVCVVCMVEERCVTLVPCGHRVLCRGCARSVRAKNDECPMCRAPIKEAMIG